MLPAQVRAAVTTADRDAFPVEPDAAYAFYQCSQFVVAFAISVMMYGS